MRNVRFQGVAAESESISGVLVLRIQTTRIYGVDRPPNPLRQLLNMFVPGERQDGDAPGCENPESLPVLVVFDKVEFLASEPVGCLVTFHKRMKLANTKYAFCGFCPDIAEVLQVTRLAEYFVLREGEEIALADSSWRAMDGS